MSNFDPRDYGDFFDENEPYIQPLDEKAPAPKPEQPPKKPKKKKGKGCLIAIAVFFILGFIGMMMNSCGGGSSSSSSTKTEQTEQTEQTQDTTESKEPDDAEIRLLARNAELYFTDIATIMTNVGTNGYDETSHQLANKADEIKADMNSIPEDTDNEALKKIRETLDAECNLAIAGVATLETGDTEGGGKMITQYTDQVKSLLEQIKQYE